MGLPDELGECHGCPGILSEQVERVDRLAQVIYVPRPLGGVPGHPPDGCLLELVGPLPADQAEDPRRVVKGRFCATSDEFAHAV